MLTILSKLFGKPKKADEINTPSLLIKPKHLDYLFLKHFNESLYFKEESFDTVLKHLNHQIDLTKLGDKLTASQKKELKLNTRLSITTDLIAVLSQKGLELPNPKKALQQVYYRATFENNRIKTFRKMISAKVSEATYNSCNDERDCTWCKANNGVKFVVSEALNDVINQNCTCEWNRGFFSPVIDFDK